MNRAVSSPGVIHGEDCGLVVHKGRLRRKEAPALATGFRDRVVEVCPAVPGKLRLEDFRPDGVDGTSSELHLIVALPDLGLFWLGAALQGLLVCAELETHVALVGPVEEGSVGDIAQLGSEVQDLIPVLLHSERLAVTHLRPVHRDSATQGSQLRTLAATCS